MKMNRRAMVVRAACAWLIVLSSLLVAPVAGQARVSGGCTATATASRSGAIDLTTATVWHVKDADVINGSGKAPTAQKAAQLKVLMFGIGLPLLDPQGNSPRGDPAPAPIAGYARDTRAPARAGTAAARRRSIPAIRAGSAPPGTRTGNPR